MESPGFQIPLRDTPSQTPRSSFPSNIVGRLRDNLVFRSKWAELNGAMGDLGTYIPIVLALTLSDDLNLGTTLIFTGIYNIVTGAIYGVPMPQEYVLVGFCYFLGVTVKYIRKVQDFSKSKSGGDRHWSGIRWSGFGYCLCLFYYRRQWFWPGVVHDFKFGSSSIEVVRFSKHAWKEGFIKGTIPQLPLSVLNSVIAVCKLSSDLFPGKGFLSLLCFGVCRSDELGGMLVWCDAMLPRCWWTGGAVQGSSLVMVLNQFPVGVLGVLLLFAGIELAMASRDMNTKEDSFVMLLCTAVSITGSSPALGFLCGIAVHLLLKLRNLHKDQSCSTIQCHGIPWRESQDP
ncbi:hypothetical protein OIU76_027399 [Salix suchowensis]|nr:hypothetical protein OIU76_027399 [Salix suchowensis]